MSIITFIGLLIFGFCLGWASNTLVTNMINTRKNKKIIDDITDRFSEVLQNVRSSKSLFKSRVNQTVYISTPIKDYGSIEVVYLLDKKDIALFKDGKCIYTSHVVDVKIIEDIITSIRIKHNNEINDTVEVLGITLSKSEFGKMFNIDIKDVEKQQKAIKKAQEDQKSDIQKIIEKNEKKMSLDDILDKIGKVGYNNLTPDEKEFLKKHNN
jgi:hypothetical protein